jgi:dihydrofolate synthase/folylpolyglutamate synthase
VALHWLDSDEPFFYEWRDRRTGERRSLRRARLLAQHLGLSHVEIPTIVVVGSKGKGTIAAYASAALIAAGRRTGTLTSPSVLHNRERMRINGTPISRDDYDALSARISAAIDRVPREPDDGYLAPTGLFTIAAVRYFVDRQCDALVLEAGMGGRSDEVSLFPAHVVAAGAIFGEHLGIIGNSVREIAEEKFGAATSDTRAIVTVPQSSELRLPAGAIVVDTPRAGVPSLSAINASAGVKAAELLLGRSVDRIPDVHLPGRLSVHHAENQTWVVDAAINIDGVCHALQWCEANAGHPSTIVLSLPDEKDDRGIDELLRGYHVVNVSVSTPHIHYTRRSSVPFSDAKVEGDVILALGTWSFIAHVFARLGVSCDVLIPLEVSFRAGEARRGIPC